jgi:putative ABC transport system permease protein
MLADWSTSCGLRLALRRLRRQPRFTILAVTCLALGIGANTGFFSLINSVYLRSLPYEEPHRLVAVHQTWLEQNMDEVPLSAADLRDYGDQARLLNGLAAIHHANFILNSDGYPERMFGSAVSLGLFDLLGAEPALGRSFTAEDEAGDSRVIVLSHELWQNNFGGRQDIIGEVIRVNREPYTVIGVMPAEFHFFQALLWTPLVLDGEQWLDREMHWLRVVARLADDASVKQAEAELIGIAKRLERDYPAANAGIGVRLEPIRSDLTGSRSQTLILLFCASAFILLLACVNLGHLQLAAAADRTKEMAIRSSLGATRPWITRQLLVESLVLALISGLGGLTLALIMIKILGPYAASSLPAHAELTIDGGVLLYTLLTSVLSVVVFGLVPALMAATTNLAEVLKEGGFGSTQGLRRLRLGELLSVSEIALALVLAIGAGLLLQSLLHLQEIDPGFEPDQLLTMRIALPAAAYSESDQIVSFVTRFIAEVEALPGVEGVGVTSHLPFYSGASSFNYEVEGKPPPPPGEAPYMVHCRQVSPGYLPVLGVPRLQGRDFTWSDLPDTPRVAIVNQSLARTYWPDENPLGRRIRPGDDPDTAPWWTVVGVTDDIHFSTLRRAPEPAVYIPFLQLPASSLALVVRATGDPEELLPSIRERLAQLDPEMPIFAVRTMDERIRRSLSQPRLSTVILSLFSGLGVVLAALGVLGSFRYMVARRRREYAIRMALGAGRRELLLGVLGQGLILALIGVVAGLVIAWLVRGLVTSQLFGVAPTHLWSWLSAALLLLGVVVLAVLGPARRATRIDPTTILRD